MHSPDNILIEEDYQKMKELVIVPKLIRRKKHILGQMMMQVKTKLTAVQLHEGQKQTRDEHKLKIMTKVTNMEHTNRTRFVAGPNAKLADVNKHTKIINENMNADERILETKNYFTREKDARSKVLSVHATPSKAKEIDERLTYLKMEEIRHV